MKHYMIGTPLEDVHLSPSRGSFIYERDKAKYLLIIISQISRRIFINFYSLL